jgi:hypothetical protein
VLPGVVQGASKRLEDRALAGLLASGPLQDNGRGRVVALLQQVVPALQQFVGRLAVDVRFVHGSMVA